MRRGMPAIWEFVKPLIVYYVGYYVVRMLVGTLLAGSGVDFLPESGGFVAGGAAIVNGIAMLGGLAALFPMIEEEKEAERREKKRRCGKERKRQGRDKGPHKEGKRQGEEEERCEDKEPRREENRSAEAAGGKKSALHYLTLVIFAASSAVFFNTLISLSGLADRSAAFQETAGNQYAVSPGMGLFLYAGVAAVAEETVFRFLLYNRLRRSAGRVTFGVVASAFLFGVYHGNIVQGVYAFVLGVLIACAYYYFDDFLAAVLFHGAGNAVIFLSNMIPEMYDIVFSPVMFWIFGLITAAGCLYFAASQGWGRKKLN